jgi:hypothetical protein
MFVERDEVYAGCMNISKHGPKVIDITERRREAIELDRFIAERGGLRLLRRRAAPSRRRPAVSASRPCVPR